MKLIQKLQYTFLVVVCILALLNDALSTSTNDKMMVNDEYEMVKRREG